MTMSDETTRLRALLDGIALPLSSAQTDSTAIEIDDAEGTYVGSVDVDHGPGLDASESTETHAALIVAAVNALPGLLDAAERAERAERERDDLAAVLETRTAEHALAMARVTELEAMLDAMNRRSRHAGLPTLCAFGDIMDRGLCAEEVSRG
jgi:hypothetical protein